MTNIGIVEGFFGPEWSHKARLSMASFLHQQGGDFYIYAPKRDPHLRKEWREQWCDNYITQILTLRDAFQTQGVKFGLGFSPFGLGGHISEVDWAKLEEKLAELKNMGLDYLGLFFDDMPCSDSLLSVQKSVVELALKYFPTGLIFCPSYYSYDSILDKVFGQRPAGYVDGLKAAIPQGVEICWTGPKVISEEISKIHLQEVKALLGRAPFIWENLYANDGPRNCKFLKLKYFSGRDQSLSEESSAVGLNLMNEPYLSQILFLSSLKVIREAMTPEVAFEKSCRELCSPSLVQFLLDNRELFLIQGLDQISEEKKLEIVQNIPDKNSLISQEILSWLRGEYLVGPECLTD